MKVLISVLLASSFLGIGLVQVSTWELSEDYEVRFTAKNASGNFSTLKGDIAFDTENLDASKFDMVIDVSSIDTGNGLKNKHARGKNWFETDQYPTISFKSESVEKTDEGFLTSGTLMMHGIEREVQIPFDFSDDIFTGSFILMRSDYGVGGTSGFAKKVPDEILVELVVPVK